MPEKYIVNDKSLEDIFRKEFLDELREFGTYIFPAAAIFVSESEKDGKKDAQPLVFGHQNSNEVKNRILHVESPNTELLSFVMKIIEKKDDDKNE